MNKGDHIRVSRLAYYHHGIYIGDNLVIHFSGEPSKKQNAEIIKTPLAEFLDGGRLEIVNHPHCLPPDEVVDRAYAALGQKGYNLIYNNCEHFALYCKTGQHESNQVDGLMNKAAGYGTKKILKGGSKMVDPISAGVAIGIVNLGVGLWNTYQLHKFQGTEQREHNHTRTEIKKVHEGMKSLITTIKTAFEEQSFILAAVLNNQDQLDAKMDWLIANIQQGFLELGENVKQITEDRRRDEYLQYMIGLSLAKEKAMEALCFDGQLSERDLLKLEMRAEDLEKWLLSRLADTTLPVYARQPYIFSLIDSIMTQQDVKLFEGGEKTAQRVIHHLEDLMNQIDGEVARLHQDVTPWDVLSRIRYFVARYGLLKLSLRQTLGKLQSPGDYRQLDIPSWNDCLPTLDLSQAEKSATIIGSFPLKTIQDYVWYTRVFVEDPATFDVHAVREIPITKFYQRLGCKQIPKHVDIDILKECIEPETWTSYNEILNTTFQIEPKVMPVVISMSDNSDEKSLIILRQQLCNLLRLRASKTGSNVLLDTIPASSSNHIAKEMILVDGGFFMMGSNIGDSDARPLHKVTLGNFLLGKYPVTFNEYDDYCKELGLALPDDAGWGRDKHPVINVSWFDAIKFCNWKSRSEGLAVAYKEDTYEFFDQLGNVTRNLAKVQGYRLPTEAEWEYAARGGQMSQGFIYSGSNDLNEVGWYCGNSDKRSHPVGQKKANELGIYDMSGNVYDWCHDWYCHSGYKENEIKNPIGPDTGSVRVNRGGCWYEENHCRPEFRNIGAQGYRSMFWPTNRMNVLGFRLARSAP